MKTDKKRTGGLVCPLCKQPRGDIESVSGNRIGFKCNACGHHWHAETGRVAGDILRGKG